MVNARLLHTRKARYFQNIPNHVKIIIWSWAQRKDLGIPSFGTTIELQQEKDLVAFFLAWQS